MGRAREWAGRDLWLFGHLLERAEEGTGQDIKRKQDRKGDSPAGGRRGCDQSGQKGNRTTMEGSSPLMGGSRMSQDVSVEMTSQSST